MTRKIVPVLVKVDQKSIEIVHIKGDLPESCPECKEEQGNQNSKSFAGSSRAFRDGWDRMNPSTETVH